MSWYAILWDSEGRLRDSMLARRNWVYLMADHMELAKLFKPILTVSDQTIALDRAIRRHDKR